MPGVRWLLTDDNGKLICYMFPLLCGDVIGAFIGADKNFDNYDRYLVFLERTPGWL